MTHTPGPWQSGGELISQEGSNLEIASVWSKQAKRPRSPGLVEAGANARLIAAAPELLASLELAVHYLEHPDVLAITQTMALSGLAVVDRVNATIAKATGDN